MMLRNRCDAVTCRQVFPKQTGGPTMLSISATEVVIQFGCRDGEPYFFKVASQMLSALLWHGCIFELYVGHHMETSST